LRPLSILYWRFSFLPHLTTYFSQIKKTRPLSWERFFSSGMTKSLRFLWLAPSRCTLRPTSSKASLFFQTSLLRYACSTTITFIACAL
jgi:hypothetical protein